MNMKDHRLAVNLTQEEVAAALGISRDDYRRYETGTIPTPLDIAVRFAELVDHSVPVSDYIGDAKERRKAIGLSRGQVATALDISESAVKHYENGIRTPDALIAKRFDALLRALTGWIVVKGK